jgi:hypothetical protein
LGFVEYGDPAGFAVVNCHGGLACRLDVAAADAEDLMTHLGVPRFAELPQVDRAYTRLSQRAPWLARQCFRTMSWVAGAAPGLYGRLAARDLGAADGRVIGDEGFATFARMSRQALSRPSGVAEEYRAWMRPWGFAPEDLSVGVDVWVGSEDTLLDPRWPYILARRIPQGRLHVRSGGHFMAHLHYGEIFDALREP